MKILQISPEFPPFSLGGGGLIVQNLALGLRRRGHDVAVISGFYAVKGLLDRPFDSKSKNIAVSWLPLLPTPNVGFQLKTIMPPNLFSLQRLLRLIAEDDSEAINIHGFGHLFCDIAAVLCRIFRRKYVLTIHGFPKEPGRRGGALSLIYRVYVKSLGNLTIGGATAVVAVSNSIARECADYGRHKRIETIQNAIDTSVFSEPPSKEQLHETVIKYNLLRKQVVLCIGRLSVAKGFQNAISALPRVRREIPDVQLVIVGKDEGYGYAQELKKLVKEKNVESSVSFVGGVDDNDKKNLLWIARVVAIPSTEEPFGIVALEAMASGKPIVASNVGGLSEILSDDRHTLFVEGGNTDQLANALIKMMKKDNALNEGIEGRTLKLARLDLKQMVTKYVDLYRTFRN